MARPRSTGRPTSGTRDDDGLFVERVEDVVDQPLGHPWGLGPDQFDESAAASSAQGGRGAVAFEEPGDGLVVEAGAEDAFQAGVELGEQAAYPIAGAGDLGGEVLVEADQDGELGGDLVGQSAPASAGCAAWCGPRPRSRPRPWRRSSPRPGRGRRSGASRVRAGRRLGSPRPGPRSVAGRRWMRAGPRSPGRCRTCRAACRTPPAASVRCWVVACRRPSCRPG